MLSGAMQALAQTGESIGRIIRVKGEVTATNAAGQTRALARCSELFQEDTIVVGLNSAAQAKTVDSAVIAFRAETEFSFNTYSYDGDSSTADTAVMTMVRGGFRTLSGSIGEEDQDDYRIDTPFASIGIRGTVHEAVLDGGILYTGVYEGGTTISNNFGSVDTGIDAEFDFSITLPDQAPEGLLIEPAVLGQRSVELVIASADDEDEARDDNGAQATTVAAAADSDDGNNNNAGNADAGNTVAASTNANDNNVGNTTPAAANARNNTGNNQPSQDENNAATATNQAVAARLESLSNLGQSQQGTSTARNALTTTTTP